MDHTKPGSDLASISDSIAECRECRLWATRTNTVAGEGPSSWILLLGEAPGAQEDDEGRPFVGAAGRFLEELLGAAGLSRRDVFITNVVKCRPPSNRIPRSDEVRACRPHLEAQLRALEPCLIVTMGAVAARALLGLKRIGESRGKPILRNGVVYLPVLHPAASLYDPSLKETLVKDFELLGRMVAEGPDGLRPAFAALKGLRTLDEFT